MRVYTHGGLAHHRQRISTFLAPENSHHFLCVLLTGFEPLLFGSRVRRRLYQLSHPVTQLVEYFPVGCEPFLMFHELCRAKSRDSVHRPQLFSDKCEPFLTLHELCRAKSRDSVHRPQLFSDKGVSRGGESNLGSFRLPAKRLTTIPHSQNNTGNTRRVVVP